MQSSSRIKITLGLSGPTLPKQMSIYYTSKAKTTNAAHDVHTK